VNYNNYKTENIPAGRFRCYLALELSAAKERKTPINAEKQIAEK
jgi:hypothetical protein